MSKKRMHKQPSPTHVALIAPEELERIRQEAEAEGEEFVVALCDVARDPLAPLSASVCMKMLRAFAEP